VNPTDEQPSKSQKKRDAQYLQSLGCALIEVPEESLAALDVPERLKDAVRAARKMRKRGAVHRQKQYIGKVMRSVDPEPIEALLEARRAPGREEARLHKQAEAWRERLLAGTDGVEAFARAFPHTDQPALSEALRAAMDEREGRGASGAGRALYRRLREIIAAAG
jgi:ribosome-associated protein